MRVRARLSGTGINGPLTDRYAIEREIGSGGMAIVHHPQGWGQAREST
jgi:hypothetical protein